MDFLDASNIIPLSQVEQDMLQSIHMHEEICKLREKIADKAALEASPHHVEITTVAQMSREAIIDVRRRKIKLFDYIRHNMQAVSLECSLYTSLLCITLKSIDIPREERREAYYTYAGIDAKYLKEAKFADLTLGDQEDALRMILKSRSYGDAVV